MAEEEEELEVEETVRHDLDILIYFHGRAEPCHIQAAFPVPKDVLEPEEDEEKVEQFMEHIEYAILSVIDTQGEHRYVFTDTHHNKRIVLVKDVQMISMLAPDKTTLRLMSD